MRKRGRRRGSLCVVWMRGGGLICMVWLSERGGGRCGVGFWGLVGLVGWWVGGLCGIGRASRSIMETTLCGPKGCRWTRENPQTHTDTRTHTQTTGHRPLRGLMLGRC